MQTVFTTLDRILVSTPLHVSSNHFSLLVSSTLFGPELCSLIQETQDIKETDLIRPVFFTVCSKTPFTSVLHPINPLASNEDVECALLDSVLDLETQTMSIEGAKRLDTECCGILLPQSIIDDFVFQTHKDTLRVQIQCRPCPLKYDKRRSRIESRPSSFVRLERLEQMLVGLEDLDLYGILEIQCSDPNQREFKCVVSLALDVHRVETCPVPTETEKKIPKVHDKSIDRS